eukprot:scaffold99697_cov59-Phaeocystis_antarctica.AAC.5
MNASTIGRSVAHVCSQFFTSKASSSRQMAPRTFHKGRSSRNVTAVKKNQGNGAETNHHGTHPRQPERQHPLPVEGIDQRQRHDAQVVRPVDRDPRRDLVDAPEAREVMLAMHNPHLLAIEQKPREERDPRLVEVERRQRRVFVQINALLHCSLVHPDLRAGVAEEPHPEAVAEARVEDGTEGEEREREDHNCGDRKDDGEEHPPADAKERIEKERRQLDRHVESLRGLRGVSLPRAALWVGVEDGREWDAPHQQWRCVAVHGEGLLLRRHGAHDELVTIFIPDDARRLPRLGHLAKGLLDRVLRQRVRAGERARLVMRVSAVDPQGEHDADDDEDE